MFVILGCLLLRRRTLDVQMKIQNNFTEVSGIIPVHVGVTKIRFWSLTDFSIFHNVRYALAILVILHTFTRNFTSAMSCKQSAVLFFALVCLTADSIDEHFMCLFTSFFE